MPMTLNTGYLGEFIAPYEYEAISAQVRAAHEDLHAKTGLGNDFLGWVNLPSEYDKSEFERIKQAAVRIQNDCDILIVIGIGGSYLGARAAIEFLRSPLYNSIKKDTPDIYFVGNSISPSYFNDIISICEGKDVCVNVISKSGTTTEPAIAFRYFRDFLIKKYGADGAKSRIYATTDKARGTLKELSDKEGYETFVIADDVGGRYSILTAVGLLPIAVSGADIDAIMKGAGDAMNALSEPDIMKNDCYRYAAIRNILYRKGKSMELVVSYEPMFTMMSEWFKQLFGESEGKDKKGLFPASVTFSTDLHSLGQFIQDGSRTMFETVVLMKNCRSDFTIEAQEGDFDGLNFLAGRNMSYVNEKAFEGTLLAHTEEGKVPNVILELSDNSEYEFGYMVYFFVLFQDIS